MRKAPYASLTRTEIKNAEQHLSDAGFWTGPIDGVFDAGSRSALIAFQKWHGRDVTGQLTIDELDVIRTSSRPGARELGYEHVEVDLDRQVLMLVSDNGSVRVLPTSTGNGKTFMDDGQESISYTPRGRFLVYDKSVGWETGPLGSVYYPNYISGGVAIHGAATSPTNRQAMVASAYQSSRRAKSASFSRWEPLCWFTTKSRLCPRRIGSRIRSGRRLLC